MVLAASTRFHFLYSVFHIKNDRQSSKYSQEMTYSQKLKEELMKKSSNCFRLVFKESIVRTLLSEQHRKKKKKPLHSEGSQYKSMPLLHPQLRKRGRGARGTAVAARGVRRRRAGRWAAAARVRALRGEWQWVRKGLPNIFFSNKEHYFRR
jgi:hypothetical protein